MSDGSAGLPRVDHLDPQPREPADVPRRHRRAVQLAQWSLTTLRERLVKIGARIVRCGWYMVFQLAEVAVPRALFTETLRRTPRPIASWPITRS